MGIKEYLDNSLNQYYIGILNNNDYELIESVISGMGGMYRFKNTWLNFEIVNDRGIIETRISSLFSENFYDLDLIIALLNRENKIEPVKSKYRKSDLSKRLSLKNESELFKNNLSQINTMFNQLNFKESEFKLDKIGNERAKLLFGDNIDF